MAGPTTPTPTATEIAILRLLWSRGSATVREVHEAVYAGTAVGYTGALKMLQNMHAKGMVERSGQGRQHVYRPLLQERRTLAGVVGGWIDGAFGGSTVALAMHALEARPVDAGELEELKAMIARIEAGEPRGQ